MHTPDRVLRVRDRRHRGEPRGAGHRARGGDRPRRFGRGHRVAVPGDRRVLVRGGAPNENRFFIDDVEVPVINHFATQGSTGGPVGMIDVNFVQDVDLLTGSFLADAPSTRPAHVGDA